jgi:hypothetical protein
MSDKELHDLDREVGELKTSLKVLIADFQRERTNNDTRWDRLTQRLIGLMAGIGLVAVERVIQYM